MVRAVYLGYFDLLSFGSGYGWFDTGTELKASIAILIECNETLRSLLYARITSAAIV